MIFRTEFDRVSRRRAALLLGATACLTLWSRNSTARETAKVYFSGHAFLLKFAEIGNEFPHLSALLASERAVEFDRALVQIGRQNIDRRTISVDFDELGQLAPGLDANVLALAFNREVVVATQIGATWKLLVELSFEVLVFDFRSRLIRASFPITTQYIDVFENKPTTSDIQKILNRLVFGEQSTGISATFWAAVAAVALPEPGTRTLRVSQVSLSDAATASIDRLGVASTGLRDQLGFEFGKFLSANQRLSILPYTSSQAVDGKMAARLADGSVFNLTIPPSDYEISLRLDGLKKVQTAATSAGAAWVYGAFVTIRVVEPLSGRAFFDGQVKLGATRTIPATAQGEPNDWPSFAEVLRQLFDEFTGALTKPDEGWADKHVVTAGANLGPLKELVELCR